MEIMAKPAGLVPSAGGVRVFDPSALDRDGGGRERMDDHWFDDLARIVGTTSSRRQTLKTLAASVGGGAAALVALGDSAAAPICRHNGRICSANSQCCSHYSSPADRTRRRRCDCPPATHLCLNGTCCAGACTCGSNPHAGQCQAPFFQGFESNNDGWHDTDDGLGPSNTAVRVASGTHGITSYDGAFHAEAQGPFPLDTSNGSAFTRWGGYSAVFPAGGYKTSVAIYLDPAGLAAASTPNDTRFDWDSAISHSDCGFGRDFVFNAGYYNDSVAPGSGPRFVIAGGNNAGRGSSYPKDPGHDPFTITTTGWYLFEHVFSDNGGVLKGTLLIRDGGGTALHSWIRSDPSDLIPSVIGGNRYGWFASQELPFLAFDDSARS
jgi:hypothetical protein